MTIIDVAGQKFITVSVKAGAIANVHHNVMGDGHHEDDAVADAYHGLVVILVMVMVMW